MTEKTKVSFYGGVSTIGGNKILLTSGNNNSILLDFGFDFNINKDYFDDFMKPRKCEILVDKMMIKAIPLPVGNLKGIYREDFLKFDKYNPDKGDKRLKNVIEKLKDQYHTTESTEEIYNNLAESPLVTEVLVSHAHADHISEIQKLHPDIEIVCSKTTKKIIDNLEKNTGGSSMLKGISKYKEILTLTKNGARPTSYGLEPIERNFHIIESDSQKECGNGDFSVKFMLTDHSIPGAGAFLITDKTTGKKIIYTGDIRQHGPQGKRTAEFIKEAKRFQADLIITEGTRFNDENKKKDNRGTEFESEKLVSEEIKKIIKKADSEKNNNKLVLIQSSSRDMWRFGSIFKALSKNRTLVIPAKIYAMMDDLKSLNFGIDLAKVKVYIPRKAWGLYEKQDYSKGPAMRNVFRINEVEAKKLESECKKPAKYKYMDLDKPFGIRADEINEHPEKYVFYIDPYCINELFDLQPPKGSYFILSSSGPFDDEGKLTEAKRNNWLDLLGIPEDKRYKCHCSGHMRTDEMVAMLNTINAKKIIPIHTTAAEAFKIKFGKKLIVPEFAKIYEI